MFKNISGMGPGFNRVGFNIFIIISHPVNKLMSTFPEFFNGDHIRYNFSRGKYTINIILRKKTYCVLAVGNGRKKMFG
jgi:hypothetical protein